jgi:hypothetical protein
MAVTIVGSSSLYHHPSIPVDQEAPLIPGVVLDDVAIHFRCGDIFGGQRRNDFGFIHFSEYKKWIDKNNTRRIGILTQPFVKKRNRQRDRGKTKECKNATYLLVEYLRDYMDGGPQAENDTISIHNGPNETLPLAFARLAMAKQSFVSLSSFGIFPIIGTFGEGYFQIGKRGINPFARFLPDHANFSNLHMMRAPVRTAERVWRAEAQLTYDWFVSDK